MAADLGDLGDLSGEGDFKDPMDPNGGIGGAADSAGNAAEAAIQTGQAPSATTLNPTVSADLPSTVTESVQTALESVPTSADSVVGKQIQANVSAELSDPATMGDVVDDSVADAAETTGKSVDQLSPDDVKAAVDKNIQAKVEAAKTAYKQTLSGAVDSLDPNGQIKSADLVDKMVEDPDGLKEELQASADDPDLKDASDQLDEKADAETDPDKKSALKEAGKKILEYGAKGLLVMAVIGALIPGAGGPIDKLASLVGQAITKVVAAAASIVQALFGPIIAAFWNFIKNLKGPLIVIGIVLGIIFLVWLYKSLFKKSG